VRGGGGRGDDARRVAQRVAREVEREALLGPEAPRRT